MEQTNRRGSLVKFIVIGALLFGLLTGGIYLVKTYILPHPAAPVEQTPQQPVVDQTPLPVEAAQVPVEAVELPTTGPKETIGSLIRLGIVAAVATSYVRSRRPYLSL
jgi:hypothetical protein